MSEDIKLNIHPLLKILEHSLSFFVVSHIMMAMPEFQRLVVDDHKGRMSELKTSVKSKGKNIIKFEVAYVFNQFNAKFNVSRSAVSRKLRANFSDAFIDHGRLVAIALFNILESSKYNKEINKSEIFKFIKHLRNAAAHGNKFNFEGKPIKNIKWRGKIIKQTEEKKQTFGRFIFLPDLFILIGDISDELDKIDKNNILK